MEHQQNSGALDFSLKQIGPHFGYATVSVPEAYVKKLYSQASFAQQSGTHTRGFSRGTTPLAYIEKNFQPHLLEHIKEFFFKYFVIGALYEQVAQRKILLAGEPRLTDVVIKPNQNAYYSFSLSLSEPVPLQGWKRLPFKAPKRKNYKDLDRQVKNFLKEEQKFQKNHITETIQPGDWVNFAITLLDDNEISLFDDKCEQLWVRIGTEEADNPFQNLFVGKKRGDSFTTKESCIQDYFSSHVDTHYPFKITILDSTPSAYFGIDHFKRHFRVRNNQELHQKLIEVFSYRNDISQRRATAEETLKLLLSRHVFEVPNHLILRQQKEILDSIHDNPDYQVYRMQNDFNDKVKRLAIKQVKEVIFMHQLACYENLSIETEDIKGYLNLTIRPRTKEFIYFEPPTTKILGQEVPISSALLGQCCLREKTLNHAIYYLTKQRVRS